LAPGDDDSSGKLVLDVLEDGLLHHVRDLVAFERRPDYDLAPRSRNVSFLATDGEENKLDRLYLIKLLLYILTGTLTEGEGPLQ
jgi:hypothetical protein